MCYSVMSKNVYYLSSLSNFGIKGRGKESEWNPRLQLLKSQIPGTFKIEK